MMTFNKGPKDPAGGQWRCDDGAAHEHLLQPIGGAHQPHITYYTKSQVDEVLSTGRRSTMVNWAMMSTTSRRRTRPSCLAATI